MQLLDHLWLSLNSLLFWMLHAGWGISPQLIQAPSFPTVRKVSKGENVYNDQWCPNCSGGQKTQSTFSGVDGHSWDSRPQSKCIPVTQSSCECVLNLPLSESVRLAVPRLQCARPDSLIPHLLTTKEIHEVHLRLSAVARSKDLCTECVMHIPWTWCESDFCRHSSSSVL